MRRRRDRVVFPTGGSQSNDPNGTLPRRTYREFEDEVLYTSPAAAVYREDGQSGRWPQITPSPVLQFEYSPAKRAKRFVARYPQWKYVLNRAPSRVQFCFERRQRREVLFALKRAGFRGSAPKKSYRRTANSNYGC